MHMADAQPHDGLAAMRLHEPVLSAAQMPQGTKAFPQPRSRFFAYRWLGGLRRISSNRSHLTSHGLPQALLERSGHNRQP
jgi:hypothetical protein